MISKKTLIEFFRISSTPSLVLNTDTPKFTIIEVNNKYLEATNTKREDLIGKGVFEAFPENESDPDADGVKNLTASLNTVIKTRKGHKMAVQKYDIPIRGTSKFELKYWAPENIPLIEDGNITMIIHTVMDVTGNILSNQRIEESKLVIEKGNQILFQTENMSKLGRWEYDVPTGKVYWSDNYYFMLGYQPQEFEVTIDKIITLLHPDDKERVITEFKRLFKYQKDYTIEFRFITRTKATINVVIRGSFIYDNEGNLKKLVGILQDITDIKAAEAAAEKAIRESNERFEYAAKATFDAIWDWDLATDYIHWGEGFEKIFGHKLSDFNNTSLSWKENIHPEDLQRITDSFYNIIKGNETNWVEEYRFKNGDGNYSYVINKGIIIRDPSSNLATRIIGAMHDISQKKREEQQLKLLESVVTNANDAVVIKEAMPSGKSGRKIIYINPAFTRMTGYTESEIIGKDHSVLHGPNTNTKELERFYKALDEKKSTEITIINYKKTGEEFWVNLVLNPVFNDKGEHTHWVSIERDVTEKKIVEEELLKRLKEITDYKYAIDESAIVAVTDQKGIIIHVNDNFCNISKYSREELLGQDHRIINSGYHSKEFIQQIWTTIAKGNIWKGELKNKTKEGTFYWVDTTIVPFLNERGKPYQYVAIRSDITDRKNQEEELSKTSQTLRTTLESIQDGFYTLDNNWNITYWNHEAERISGVSQQKMLGKNFWDLYENRMSKLIYSKFHFAKDNNTPVRFEVFSKTQSRWYELNAFPYSLGLTVYFKDINERKQNEAKLKKMNRMLERHVKELAVSNEELEQFAYVASHDLQEPLRMVTGFLTQIEKKYGDLLDEKGKQYIYFAVDGAKRMRQIILDLLEFSRIGKKEDKLENVILNDVLDEIVLLYSKQIKEKSAKIEYGDLPQLRTHSAAIKQIFQNLISNSLKYSKSAQAPIITINSEETGTVWKFIVKDNGIGINSEYFAKIFIIFQRLHNKDEYSGTGMGLAITKKIVENLGGQIWLESKEGVGTTFHFTIPKKQKK